MARLSFLLCLLLSLASLLLGVGCYNHLGHTDDKHAALFIFGDSLFDAGNNNYINTSFRSNFRPYGESFFKYPTGRFSDGRLIPDFIAEYAKLPLIPPYLQPSNHQYIYGANFASAGSGALNETFPGLVINLKTQLSYFKNVGKQLGMKLGDTEAEQLLLNAVYLFSIGSNDYVSPFLTNSTFYHSYSQAQYVDMVIANLTQVIKEIYKKGGRKFGLLSLGPLGCLPLIRALNYPRNAGDCMEEITALAKLHNEALSQTLQKLQWQLKGFMYSNFEFYTPFSEIINNPSKYGFKEGKSACCGSGPYRGVSSCGGKRGVTEYELCRNVSEYVFFDSGHPSERANQQFAKLMWSGTSDMAWPYNLKALFEHTSLN